MTTQPLFAAAPDWARATEALRNRALPIKMTTSEPLIVASGSRRLDGWRYVFSPDTEVNWAVEVDDGAELTLTNFELVGSMGKVRVSAALNSRSESPATAGRVPLLEDGSIIGWSDDAFKLYGVPDATQTLRRLWFGPQYPIASVGPHSDILTFVAVLGDILIESCLFDHVEAGMLGGGDNNVLRIVANTKSRAIGRGTIRLKNCVIHGDPYKSFLIQIANSSDYAPHLVLEDCLLPISRIGMKKLFHPSSPLGQVRMTGCFDTYTGKPVHAPKGADGE